MDLAVNDGFGDARILSFIWSPSRFRNVSQRERRIILEHLYSLKALRHNKDFIFPPDLVHTPPSKRGSVKMRLFVRPGPKCPTFALLSSIYRFKSRRNLGVTGVKRVSLGDLFLIVRNPP